MCVRTDEGKYVYAGQCEIVATSNFLQTNHGFLTEFLSPTPRISCQGASNKWSAN